MRGELRRVVSEIPLGRVLAYGQVGRRMTPPTTGRIVGQLLSHGMDDIPWWRVVNAQGELSIARRDPVLMQQQRAHLAAEGVELTEAGRVPMGRFLPEDEE
jgi:methylated-DNA-protein-cysteine methyltransferase-like protein